MRVLHVTPAYHPAHAYGGPIRSVHGLTRALAREGASVHVLTTNANGLREVVRMPTNTLLEPERNLAVYFAPRVALHSVSPALVARLESAVEWADVVHLTGVYSFTTFPTLGAVRLAQRPLVWSPRGSLQRWANTRRRAAKAAWELACRRLLPERAVLHATSDDEAEQTKQRMPGLPCVVIPNGVDVPDNSRHEPSDTYRVLFLGRLDPIKGIENLLEAAASLPGHVTLTVAGAGDAQYATSLRARAQALGLGARASFVGEVADEDKAALFATSDVLVLPSFSENFGLVVAEALGHGVPAVAARGTPWRVLEERGLGKWVDNGAQSLALALSALRVADRVAMGAAGRAWVREQLGWPAVARRMLGVYQGLVGA